MSDTQNTYSDARRTEYHPERMAANGTDPEITVGEPEQVWEEYGLEILPIEKDGTDTNRRWIMRNGNFVKAVSDRYRLLPNERAVEVANDVAERVGAKPFHKHTGDWYIQLDDHVFQDHDGKRVHALYSFDEKVDLGHGDEVDLGFAVHNSIDKSMGFKVGLFTFRHACANMVTMGVDTSGMGFDDRDVIEHYDQKHTAGLDIDILEAIVENTIDLGPRVIEAYSAWQDDELDVWQTESLLRRAQRGRLAGGDLPGWMQDALEALETAEERAEQNESFDPTFENGLPQQAQASIIEANIPEAETVWDAYNDLTANIWHSETTNDRSKMRKFGQVHKTFTPFAEV